MIDVKRMKGVELDKDEVDFLNSQVQHPMLIGMQQPPMIANQAPEEGDLPTKKEEEESKGDKEKRR